MNNSDIKNLAKSKKIKLWRIAERLGIADSSFSRKLRYELPQEKKTEIIKIIDELAAEKQGR